MPSIVRSAATTKHPPAWSVCPVLIPTTPPWPRRASRLWTTPATGRVACGWATICAKTGCNIAVSPSVIKSAGVLTLNAEKPLTSAYRVALMPSAAARPFTRVTKAVTAPGIARRSSRLRQDLRRGGPPRPAPARATPARFRRAPPPGRPRSPRSPAAGGSTGRPRPPAPGRADTEVDGGPVNCALAPGDRRSQHRLGELDDLTRVRKPMQLHLAEDQLIVERYL